MAEQLCVLEDIPDEPTTTQVMLLEDQVGYWYVFAGLLPFILLVLIGGWNETFKSGDASAYVVGAIIVGITENFFQQREDDFATFRRLLSSFRKENVKAGNSSLRGTFVQNLLIAVGCTVWNLYYAVHDRRVSNPTVDWVQILLFSASLGALAIVRFAGTDWDEFGLSPGYDSAWPPRLLREIERLHSKGNHLIQEAAPHAGTREYPDKLKEAVSIFEKIDDLWCQARAQQALADAWEDEGSLKKANKTRKELIKTRQKLERAVKQRHVAAQRVTTRGRHARPTQKAERTAPS